MNQGKYKNMQGEVLKVYRKKNMLLVKGVNLKFKKVESEENIRRMKTIEKEYPIHVSNCLLVDPHLKLGTRVRYGFLEDGTKVRVSKKTGAIIPKPSREDMTYLNRTKNFEAGPSDTDPE